MHVHRIVGPSLREALQRARRLHGEDAVVVGQEIGQNGAVTLTVARRTNVTTPPILGTRGETRVQPKDTAVNEVAARLKRQGASPNFVERVMAGVAEHRAEGVHVLDTAADVLGELFPTAVLPKARGRARVLALAGAAGVGKTTTIAKLAMRLVRARRRVELVTFDADRPGAVEQLRAWAQMLGTPFTVARTGNELESKSIATADLVLVDTSGRPDRDLPRLERMRAACEGAGSELQTYLVLAASASSSTLRTVTETYAPAQPTAAVVTKLDETREPVGVLEHVLDSQLAVAFLANGPDVATDLHRADAGLFADLCLRGRIA